MIKAEAMRQSRKEGKVCELGRSNEGRSGRSRWRAGEEVEWAGRGLPVVSLERNRVGVGPGFLAPASGQKVEPLFEMGHHRG